MDLYQILVIKMVTYAELFKKITGTPPSKRIVNIGSDEPLDRNLFESLARLYFTNKKKFNLLKIQTKKIIKKNKSLIYTILGYMHYIECEFEDALKCFKKALQLNSSDLELIYDIAFCYRQLGGERDFKKVLLKETLSADSSN